MYFNNLYKALSDKDQRHMSEDFRSLFTEEVETDGFTRGAKSFLVTGPGGTENCKYAYACLTRGNYPAAYLEPMTIIRRLDSKWIPSWEAEDDAVLETAETLILVDPFDPEFLQSITAEQKGTLVWFVKDAINNGVVVVIPTNKSADLNSLGENFGALIEQNFEVFHGTQAPAREQFTETKQKSATSQRKHGGDAATGKRGKPHKRTPSKGHKP